MILADTPHKSGEIVDNVQDGSQAYTAGVRKGWIITNLNGRQFSDTERLKDLATDFDKAKAEGTTLIVKYDVRTAIDCANSNCANSDKFPTDTMSHCATACGLVEGCTWWSYGPQDGEDMMCKFYGKEPQLVQPDSVSPEAANAAFLDTTNPTLSVGKKACMEVQTIREYKAFEPWWPSCTNREADLHYGKPLFTDVRSFINHPDEVRHREIIFSSDGNIGMALSATPTDLGEIVGSVLPSSQAQKFGVRAGWIIKEVAGQPFKAAESLIDIGADFATDKTKAPTITVKFDIRSRIDCTDGDCTKSDKFPAPTAGECADACYSLSECMTWSYATEQEDKMCWLRSDVPLLRARAGSLVGGRECIPPRKRKWFVLVAVLGLIYVYLKRPEWLVLARGLLGRLSPQKLIPNRAGKYGQGLELGAVKKGDTEEFDPELDSLLGPRDDYSKGSFQSQFHSAKASWSSWLRPSSWKTAASSSTSRMSNAVNAHRDDDFDL